MPKKETYLTIPRTLMAEGTALIKRNILDLLDVAEGIITRGKDYPVTIYEDNTLRYAYALVHFAIEEYGKALLLKETYETDPSDTIKIPKKSQFLDHHYKFNKAFEVLNPNLKTVYEGAFDRKAFDPAIFDTDIEASPRLRLECVFVDYKEQHQRWEWFFTNIDKEKLQALMHEIYSKIDLIRIPPEN